MVDMQCYCYIELLKWVTSDIVLYQMLGSLPPGEENSHVIAYFFLYLIHAGSPDDRLVSSGAYKETHKTQKIY